MRRPRDSRESFPRAPILACFGTLAALAATEASAPGRFTSDAGTADVEVDAGATEDVAVDVKPGETLAAQAGRHIPPKPDKGWKLPPCGEVQVEVNGSCWVLPARPDGTLPKPPCPVGLYEYRGRCYQPVGAVQRPDTSVGE